MGGLTFAGVDSPPTAVSILRAAALSLPSSTQTMHTPSLTIVRIVLAPNHAFQAKRCNIGCRSSPPTTRRHIEGSIPMRCQVEAELSAEEADLKRYRP